LYTALAQTDTNRYMRYPYFLGEKGVDGFFANSGLSAETIALIKRLVYSRHGNQYFSDVEFVLHRLANADDRLKFMKTLTRQFAVLPRLRVRPDTDIDKVLSYWTWAPGVRVKDVRPLLESLQRLPN